jgi:DNA repair protein RadA/Sms
VPKDTVIFGEIGLAGEIRHVPQPELRLKEAAKLGFKSAFIPKPAKTAAAKDKKSPKSDMTVEHFDHLTAVARLFKKPVHAHEA